MKNVFYISLVSLLMSGCTESTPPAKDNSGFDSSDFTVPSQPIDTLWHHFAYENDTLTQTAEIRQLALEKITFKLQTINKLSKDSSVISGIASSNYFQDPETDDDTDGMYSSVEYIFATRPDSFGNCTLYIRVEKDTFYRLVVLNNKGCFNSSHRSPLSSQGILRVKR